MRSLFGFSRLAFRQGVVEVLASAVAGCALVALGALYHVVPLDILISIGATLVVCLVVGLVLHRRSKPATIGPGTGLVGLWRDQASFEEQRGVSYREYCRRFIRECPDGGLVRVLGYDWVELFQDTTLLADDIFVSDGTSRIRFEVVLVDPASPAPFEKRAWEMSWKSPSGDPLYPEGVSDVSMQRLSSKIEQCVTVVRILQQERPQYVKLRLTPTLLGMSAIIREDRVVGMIYAPPWKGGDSVIFEAERLHDRHLAPRAEVVRRRLFGADLYGFILGYWDAVWQDPDWRLAELVRRQKKAQSIS